MPEGPWGLPPLPAMWTPLGLVEKELLQADEREGLPDGTGLPQHEWSHHNAHVERWLGERDGWVTWGDFLRERFWAAMAESDEEKLKDELIKLAATSIEWWLAIDRREPEEPSGAEAAIAA